VHFIQDYVTYNSQTLQYISSSFNISEVNWTFYLIHRVYTWDNKINIADWKLGRFWSRLRSYNPVEPRLISCRPFVHRLSFRPSFPEAPHFKRYKRPLLVKDGITGGEMAGQFGLPFRLSRKSHGCLRAANLRHWTDGFILLRRESCCGFYTDKSDCFTGFEYAFWGYQWPAW
jgi:hypothetical protein